VIDEAGHSLELARVGLQELGAKLESLRLSCGDDDHIQML
jgi:hypothetical protein